MRFRWYFRLALFLCVPHAVFEVACRRLGRALVWVEPENLMVEEHILVASSSFPPDLFVTRRVLTCCDRTSPASSHVVRPALRVRTAVHVEESFRKHFAVIVTMAPRRFFIMCPLLYARLLDDGHLCSPLFFDGSTPSDNLPLPCLCR